MQSPRTSQRLLLTNNSTSVKNDSEILDDTSHRLTPNRNNPETTSEGYDCKSINPPKFSTSPHQLNPLNGLDLDSNTPKSDLTAALKAHPRQIDYSIAVAQQQRIATSWPHITESAFQSHHEFARLYHHIRSYNLPNFLGAKCVLASDLKLDKWEELLASYHDREICAFLKYGWPVGYDSTEPPVSVTTNHDSAKRDLPQVIKFVQTELAHGAIVGPFKVTRY